MSSAVSVSDAPRLVSIVRWASLVISTAQVPVAASAGVTSIVTPSSRMSCKKKFPDFVAADLTDESGRAAKVGQGNHGVGGRTARTTMQ